MSSENVSALIASLQGNGAVNGLNADINFPGSSVSNANDLTTKSYVDTTAEGLHVLTPVDVATQDTLANITSGTISYDNGTAGVGATLTTSSGNFSEIDGQTSLANATRILVKNEAATANNGIYTKTSATVLTRETDFDSPEEIRIGDFVFCINGTANGGHGFVMSSSNGFTSTKIAAAGTVGTSTIVFTQFSGVSETVTVAQGGTGATSLTDGSVLIGSGTSAVTALALGNTNILIGDGSGDPTVASLSGDVTMTNAGVVAIGTDKVVETMIAHGTSVDAAVTNVLAYTSGNVVQWAPLARVCFLKGTKITLPDFSQKSIEDLTLTDDVLTYNIDTISDIKNKKILKNVQMDTMNGKFSQSGIRNIWINPTDSYLVINEKLKVTKNHIVHFKRDNQYYFRYSEHLSIGDELFTDKGNYESVESIEEVRELTNVYNFELDKDSTYFAENYLVHHYCELCSGYSNIL